MELPGSNLSQHTNNPEDFLGIPQTLQVKLIKNLEKSMYVHKCGSSEMVNEISISVFEVSVETSVSQWHFIEQQRKNVCLGKTF
jgi:hypothetical protein